MTFLATIIILVKNGAPYLCASLPAIYEQQTDFKFLVLAIDSGSSDGSLELLAQYPARVVEISPATFNHGDTRNLGAELADPKSDVFVYLSQDAEPRDAMWLANLVRPLREDAAIAGAFSRHIPRSTSSPALVRQLRSVWSTGRQHRRVKRMPDDDAIYECDKLDYVAFSNTSSAIQRAVWEAIPFRRTSFAEDAQWADAVLRAGYALAFEPSSVVVHSHDYSAVEQFRQNVDHVVGMARIFPNVSPRGLETWFRLFAGIPQNVLQDWRFTWRDPYFASQSVGRKFRWMLHSPIWHTSSALGTWVGAHLSWFPPRLRLAFSRQERIRLGKG